MFVLTQTVVWACSNNNNVKQTTIADIFRMLQELLRTRQTFSWRLWSDSLMCGFNAVHGRTHARKKLKKVLDCFCVFWEIWIASANSWILMQSHTQVHTIPSLSVHFIFPLEIMKGGQFLSLCSVSPVASDNSGTLPSLIPFYFNILAAFVSDGEIITFQIISRYGFLWLWWPRVLRSGLRIME